MPKNDLFRGDLTDEDLGIIEDALQLEREIRIYGDGREQYQAKVDKIIKKLYSVFYEVA